MDDDFNTPQALACLHGAATRANQLADAGAPAADQGAWRGQMEAWLSVLGLPLAEGESAAYGSAGPEAGGQPGEADELVELLLAERQKAREAKDFAASDRIRGGLAALGIEVKDQAGGALWSRAKRGS